MMLGQWVKAKNGMDIYIVDYPNIINPHYDEAKAKKIAESAKKYANELRELLNTNKNNKFLNI